MSSELLHCLLFLGGLTRHAWQRDSEHSPCIMSLEGALFPRDKHHEFVPSRMPILGAQPRACRPDPMSPAFVAPTKVGGPNSKRRPCR